MRREKKRTQRSRRCRNHRVCWNEVTERSSGALGGNLLEPERVADGRFRSIADERRRGGHELRRDRRTGRRRVRRVPRHHQLSRVLLRFDQHHVDLREKQAEQLDQSVQRQRQRQSNYPDDVARGGQVEGHESQPQHDRRVIGERDASGLVESLRAFSRLDRVERGRDGQQERVDQTDHVGAVFGAPTHPYVRVPAGIRALDRRWFLEQPTDVERDLHQNEDRRDRQLRSRAGEPVNTRGIALLRAIRALPSKFTVVCEDCGRDR